jgi:hypothetical protein
LDVRDCGKDRLERSPNIKEILVLNPMGDKFVRHFDEGFAGCKILELNLTKPCGEFSGAQFGFQVFCD